MQEAIGFLTLKLRRVRESLLFLPLSFHLGCTEQIFKLKKIVHVCFGVDHKFVYLSHTPRGLRNMEKDFFLNSVTKTIYLATFLLKIKIKAY